jgi:hypothetical protein
MVRVVWTAVELCPVDGRPVLAVVTAVVSTDRLVEERKADVDRGNLVVLAGCRVGFDVVFPPRPRPIAHT